MCPWTPLDPLDPQLRAHFVRSSYEVRTKCANSTHTWAPFAHVLPPLQATFPLYRHTPPAALARRTALAAEMAAATGTTAGTATSSSTSSSSSSMLGASGAPAPVPVPAAPAAAQLGAPTGPVGSDMMECTNKYDANDPSSTKLALDTMSPQAKLFGAWRDSSGNYAWTWTLRFLHVRSGVHYRMCMPCRVTLLPNAHKDGTDFVARFAYLVRGGHWYVNLAALPGDDGDPVLEGARPAGVGTPKILAFGPYEARWADSAQTAAVASINERQGKHAASATAMDVDAADTITTTTTDTTATTDTTTAEGRARKRGRKDVAPPTVPVPTTTTAPVPSSADASALGEMRVQVEWLQAQLQAARDSLASKEAMLMHEKVERAKAETQLQALQSQLQSQPSAPKVGTRAAGAAASAKGAAATIPPAVAYLATAVQELKEAGTALRHGADTAIKVGQTLCATTSALKDTDFKGLAREGADAAAVTKFNELVAKYDTATIMATMSDPTWSP